MRRALITGISGQDGFYLAKFLHAKNYEVFGMLNGQKWQGSDEISQRLPFVNFVPGDLTDSSSLQKVLIDSVPHEIYNLAAISHVGVSFQFPETTANVTGLGVLRLLEAVRSTNLNESTRIYQASSSEMFGKVYETPQNENTKFNPRSPYAVSKLFAHEICKNYRDSFGMHISCGILFNHESEIRGSEFVTRKITQGLAKIRAGRQEHILLGDLTPKRDWGHAEDFVEAMWLMLQQDLPDDYVVSTNESHSVEEFLKLAFNYSNLPGDYSDYLQANPKLFRPAEVMSLQGDFSKARQVLGWNPKIKFDELVRRMIENDLAIELG